MSKRPWFPLYVGDLLADTMNFDDRQFGGYIRILCHYWMTEEPMTVDEMQSASGLSKNIFQKSWPVLSKKFVLENEKYFNRRMRREIIKAVDISEKRSEAGSKGGQANASLLLDQLPTHLQSQLQLSKELGGGANNLEKTAPHVFVEKERKHDYSNWKPSDIIKDRIRLNCTGIDDKFIDGCVAEFVTYAETHYTPDQLDSRFIKSVTSDHKHTQLRGYKVNAKPAWASIPADDNELWNWANEHGFRAPGGTETYIQYRNQLKALVAKRLDKEQA